MLPIEEVLNKSLLTLSSIQKSLLNALLLIEHSSSLLHLGSTPFISPSIYFGNFTWRAFVHQVNQDYYLILPKCTLITKMTASFVQYLHKDFGHILSYFVL